MSRCRSGRGTGRLVRCRGGCGARFNNDERREGDFAHGRQETFRPRHRGEDLRRQRWEQGNGTGVFGVWVQVGIHPGVDAPDGHDARGKLPHDHDQQDANRDNKDDQTPIASFSVGNIHDVFSGPFTTGSETINLLPGRVISS